MRRQISCPARDGCSAEAGLGGFTQPGTRKLRRDATANMSITMAVN
jgi:hypothetical protein